MSDVYIVTSGTYSMYSIRGVFSTEELAQAYIAVLEKQGYYSDLKFEVFQLDAHENTDLIARDIYRYAIDLPRGEYMWKEYMSDYISANDRDYHSLVGGNSVGVSYESMARAEKLAVEGRQAFLAERGNQ